MINWWIPLISDLLKRNIIYWLWVAADRPNCSVHY